MSENRIKEIIVFTTGDADDIATWSNVPYFFTRTLAEKGIKVHKINIAPEPFRRKLYEKTVKQLIKLVRPKTSHDYFRSKPHFNWVQKKIKKALQDHPNADLCLFLTFSFSSAGLTTKPTVLFGDWTYDHFFKYFANREPDAIERATLDRENKQIEGADLVFPLFPGVEAYMKERYKNPNIHYLGNVVNSLLTADKDDILKQKENSQQLLFIGGKKYLPGANALIEAYKLLKPEYPNLSVHIVGTTATDYNALPDGVHCYGYLDKGVKAQQDQYYDLLQKAKLVINTTPKWGAFSSTVECMYFYTPVITTPYEDFKETFGKEIDFGFYCEENDPKEIASLIRQTLELDKDSYKQMSLQAHEAVKDYSWSAYIDKMLAVINSKKLSPKDRKSERPI